MSNPFIGPYQAAPSTVQVSPAAQTAPASTSAYKMQGFGELFTPQASGRVLILFQAVVNASATTVGNGINVQLYYGPISSGTAAPANAAAIPTNAVAVGPVVTWATGVTLTTAADSFIPLAAQGVVLGLTIGQQYWFDVAAESVTTVSDNQLIQVGWTLIEV
jgi:hypothetical protein